MQTMWQFIDRSAALANRSGLNAVPMCAAVLLLLVGAAGAQDRHHSERAPPPAESANAVEAFFRWIDDAFKTAGEQFSRDRERAASMAVGAAREAADAVTALPKTRVMSGRQNCPKAANGAPDCVIAANLLCKARGHQIGKSLEITSAQECPAAVMLGRREAAPGECKTVTFVTRAVCQ